MIRIEALVEALTNASEPCRRLDAMTTVYALAPAGSVLDPIEDIDGWGILGPANAKGKRTMWMCAADVGYVTRYMDAAMELIVAARPDEAAAIATRALVRLLSQPCVGDFSQRTSCQMIAELLRSSCVLCDAECVPKVRSAA